MRRYPLLVSLISCLAACGAEPPLDLSYSVPMQQGAYWPKFRRTPENSGRSPVLPGRGQAEVWSFTTGKGIFSSPVIDRDGTIYLGSADATFYAVRPDGTLKWKQKLGELVDSSALIGEDGTIYVGSGDGHLYAFTAQGEERWRFQPQGGAFITWFEGNVVMGPDGTIYAGNDDFHLYAVDSRTGTQRWSLRGTDQIWSAAGVAPDGTLFYGGNDLRVRAVDPRLALEQPAKVEQTAVRWEAATLGPVTSSPLLTPAGHVVVGSFDGFLHGFDQKTGAERWKLPTREHVYASAARAEDGTLYLPSADGTLYAFSEDGTLRWRFDTLDPIRSSPSVGGDGTIYFGGGDGRLYAINPDGTRRWSFDTSVDDRNDLNSSPALGPDAIYVAGEDGKLWSVPYDYCLRSSDQRCSSSAKEDLAEHGAELYRLTPGGSSRLEAAQTIGSGESIALRLVVRAQGDTVDASLDSEQLKVTITPTVEHQVSVAADGTFLALVPGAPLAPGSYSVRVEGSYVVNTNRFGRLVTGTEPGGQFARTFTFSVPPARLSTPTLAPSTDEVKVLDLQRLAVPQPVMLPSFNQIGFDFMHLLVGVLEADPASGRVLAWVSAARVDGGDVVVDSGDGQQILFPLVGRLAGDTLVLDTSSFRVEFGNVEVPIDRLRLGGTLEASGASAGGLSLFGATTCKNVEYYGGLLRLAGLCHPKTDQLVLLGTALLAAKGSGGKRPAGLTAETPVLEEAVASVDGKGDKDGSLTVKLSGALPGKEHRLGLLLLDAQGKPYPLGYGQQTKNLVDASGKITGATLTLKASDGVKAGAVEVIVLHDLFPLGRFKL